MLASYRGYTVMQDWLVLGMFETVASFLSASIYYFWVAGAMGWIGKMVGMKKRSASRAVSIPMFGFAISLVIHSGAQLILEPSTSIYTFVSSIVAGFILLFTAVYIEKK